MILSTLFPPSPSLIPSEVPYCVFGHYPLTADASCEELLRSSEKVGRQMKEETEESTERERETHARTHHLPLEVVCARVSLSLAVLRNSIHFSVYEVILGYAPH